jgi:hypothetical protein
LRDLCGWSLTQVSVHLERLVALEYLALRHGRLGSAFVYEILFDLDAPETVAHVGLIDVRELKGSAGVSPAASGVAPGASTHHYTAKLTAFPGGVSGGNGQITGGVETAPTPLAPLALNALAAR